MKRGIIHIAGALLLAATAPTLRADSATGTTTSDAPFRIGFTTSMFSDVNVDDARAAMKVWIRTVGNERNIPIDPEPEIYADTAAARKALVEKRIDGLALTADIYHELHADIRFELLAEAVVADQRSDQYVLLAHEQSGVNSIADLRGRSLVVFHNPRMSLAAQWVDGLLRGQGLAPSAGFFSQIEKTSKASQALLPVFFRKVDAAIVTKRALALAGELNPQLLQRLKTIATSPAVHPSLFAFREGSTAIYREQMFEAIKGLHDSPAGRQILLLAQSERVEPAPVTDMDETLRLIDEWRTAGSVTNAPGKAIGPQPVSGGGS